MRQSFLDARHELMESHLNEMERRGLLPGGVVPHSQIVRLKATTSYKAALKDATRHAVIRGGNMTEYQRQELNNVAVACLIVVFFVELGFITQDSHPLLHLVVFPVFYLAISILIGTTSGVCIQSAAAGGVLVDAARAEHQYESDLEQHHPSPSLLFLFSPILEQSTMVSPGHMVISFFRANRHLILTAYVNRIRSTTIRKSARSVT